MRANSSTRSRRSCRRATSCARAASDPASHDHLGRSQHQLVAVGEGDAAPLPARGERHLERDRLRRAAELRVQRVGRRVAAAQARREHAQRARRTSRSSAPETGTISSTASVPSVSVPVLSRQTTSRPARASTAGSRCTSAPRRPTRAAATANTRLASSTRPSGTSETMPATAVETASRVGMSCTCRAYSSSAEIGIMSATSDPEQAVDGELQRRELAAVLARDARELVRVGVGADALGLVDAAAGDAEGARLHAVAGAPRVRVGLAGEDRLVDLQPAGLEQPAVGHDLVARAQHDRVARRRRRRRGPSRSAPSRRTRARGAASSARRSSARLARISWTMPMPELTTSTPANSRSASCPVAIRATAQAASTRLNSVSRLRRMIAR